MKLHYFKDGRIFMVLNLRGIKIEKEFSDYDDYIKYLNTIL